MWLVSIAAALLASNIDVVVRLLGSLAAAFIFILPGVCLLNHGNTVEDNCASLRRVLLLRVAAVFYILMGVFTFGISVTLAVQSAFYPGPDGEGAPLCVPGGSNATVGLFYGGRHHLSTLFNFN